MRNIYKWYADHLLRPFVQRRLNRSVVYSGYGLKLTIFPGVFHPGYFHSTKGLIDYVLQDNLEGKSLLELGCGSGLISMVCHKRGAIVTATDINPDAIETLKINMNENNLQFEVLVSDLFEKLNTRFFDYILINPPYYPKKPKQVAEYAWFCGTDFEYFRNLFEQLKERFSAESKILMVLSEYCDLNQIQRIAGSNDLALLSCHAYTKRWEKQIVYQLITKS